MLRDIDRSQDKLIDTLNHHFRRIGREVISTEGMCFGLSLVWLQKMVEGKVEWFYSAVDKIIRCSDADYGEIDILVEKFLAMVQWAQNSLQYITNVDKDEVSHLLEIQGVEKKNFIGTDADISNTMRVRRNPIMHLMSANGHCVAVFQQHGFYHVYDSNNPSGHAAVFANKELAVRQVKYCFFTAFNHQAPDQFSIEIFSFRPARKNLLLLADEPNQDIEEYPCAMDVDAEPSQGEMKVDAQPTQSSFKYCTIL